MKTIKLIALLFITTANLCYAFDATMFEKNHDLQAINATVRHPNGRYYFFVGKYFHEYNLKTKKLERMARIGKDGWFGVPADMDAAVVHQHKGKAYLFKGNMYYRYNFSTRKVEKKGILNKDGWKGVHGPIDAVVMHPTNNCAYFFKGKEYHRFSFSKKKVDKIGTIGKDGGKGVPSNIDGTVMHQNGKAYFFKGDNYYTYNFSRKNVDNLNGIIGRDQWKGLFHQLDAVVFNDKDKNNATRNEHYIRGNYGYYKSIEDNIIWGILHFENSHKTTKKRLGHEWYIGIPPNIDAGFLHPKNGRYYFFKGDMYHRYNPSTRKVDKSNNIKKGFGLSKVLAAVGIPKTSHIYLFDGVYYYLYDVDAKKISRNGTIASRFKGVPNWIDAAVWDDYGKVIKFYKKDMVYAYSIPQGKIIRWGSLQPGLFK